MSVLFQALSKAAQDYRDQSEARDSDAANKSRLRPGPENRHADDTATIVPLWPQPAKPFRFKLSPALCAAAFTGVTLTAGLFFYAWQQRQPDIMLPSPPLVVAAQPQKPPEKPVVKAAPPSPAGIMLPAEKLAPEGEGGEELAEMTRQLADIPFNPPDAETAVSPSHLTVDEPDIALPDPWRDEARTAAAAGDTADALRIYDRVLTNDEDNEAALTGKAYLLQQTNSRQSLDDLRDMAADHENLPAIQAALARALARHGENQTALAAWQRAVALDPANREYRLSLAILYDRMGQGAKALAHYRKLPEPLSGTVQRRVDFLASRALPDSP